MLTSIRLPGVVVDSLYDQWSLVAIILLVILLLEQIELCGVSGRGPGVPRSGARRGRSSGRATSARLGPGTLAVVAAAAV